jgi:hypothetical protein
MAQRIKEHPVKSYKLCLIALMVCGAASPASIEAGFRHRAGPRCAPPSCGAPAYCTPCANIGGHYEDRVVTRNVYVREMQNEMRTVTTIVMEPEQRSRTYTVCRRVPYTESMVQDYTVMVQQTQMRTVTETVYKPVMRDVAQNYTVMVPHQEVRNSVRHIPVCEPTTVTRRVCVDRGHWETRQVQVPCGGPGYGYGAYGYGYGGYGYGGYGYAAAYSTGARSPCGGCGRCGGCAPPPTVTQCVRVWVPNLVTQDVQCTVMQTRLVAQPYQYTVTVCKPEQRTRNVQVCETVAEQVTKQVPVTVCVPEKQSRTVQVTRYRDVTEQKTDAYTVMVPKRVTKEVAVQVCKMVPKTIEQTIRVWVPDSCGAPAANPASTSEPVSPLPVPPKSVSPHAAALPVQSLLL